MMKCDPRAYESCPYQEYCGAQEDAAFIKGSDCERFNEEVIRNSEEALNNA